MLRPRFQFRLSTLLWITLAVACFFGGMRVERRLAKRDNVPLAPQMPSSFWGEKGSGFARGEIVEPHDSPVPAPPPTE